MNQPLFSATLVAEILNLRLPKSKRVLPTPEQQAVIECVPEGPVLVIAGAGSGKTETLSHRVVWLIANGFAQPEQVLGLTFTVKAAGELSERVRRQLIVFCENARNQQLNLTEAQGTQVEMIERALEGGLNTPDISTYDSFAASVVQEFGQLLGGAGGETIVDADILWDLAEQVVREAHPTAPNSAFQTYIESVIGLNDQLVEQLCSPDELSEYLEREFVQPISSLPPGLTATGRAKKNPPESVEKALVNARQTIDNLVPMVQEFRKLKVLRGYVTFADRAARAVEILEGFVYAREALRNRYPLVLLDEVQDTSSIQSRLLSAAFRGAHVMGVGDPNQSIYGWRGAATGVLEEFGAHFAPAAETARTARLLSLSVSWRNPKLILDAANAVSSTLNSPTQSTTGISGGQRLDVLRLQSKEEYISKQSGTALAPAANASVTVRYPETEAEEYQQLAQWFVDHLRPDENGTMPTAAVLVRKRKAMEQIELALRERHIPVTTAGNGGVFRSPEVIDIVCALRVLGQENAASELIRLLAGPRFAIGLADLRQLTKLAQRLTQEQQNEETAVAPATRTVTLVDALDALRSLPKSEGWWQTLTAPGGERLLEASKLFAHLRYVQSYATLTELVREVEWQLRLDLEVATAQAARASVAGEPLVGGSPRSRLDGLIDAVQGYSDSVHDATLKDLLAWIERVSDDDRLSVDEVEPEPGTVQISTVHSAKGLEWDLVAVPGMRNGDFPGPVRSEEASGGFSRARVPEALRVDAPARKHLQAPVEFHDYEMKSELDEDLKRYRAQIALAHETEERRLAYVAITRARRHLWCSGHFWGAQKSARPASQFLADIAAVPGVLGELPEGSEYESKPENREQITFSWPRSALGVRESVVHEAATAVAQYLGHGDKAQLSPARQLLLAELAQSRQQRSADITAQLPERLNASDFSNMVADPVQATQRRRRPVPRAVSFEQELGTLFHEWLEARLLGASVETAAGGEQSADRFAPERVLPRQRSAFENLQHMFEQSQFAALKPDYVELPLSIPFAGVVLNATLDAVYQDVDRPGHWIIVDWKTGRAPKTEKDKTGKLLQLELYVHALAQHLNIDTERISATLYYLRDGEEVPLTGLRTLEELEAQMIRAVTAAQSGTGAHHSVQA